MEWPKTNRILCLAKGLTVGKISVKVLITRPTERKTNIINTNNIGVVDGVIFQYLSKNMIWPDKKMSKLIVLIKSFCHLLFYLYKNKEQWDFIVICNPMPWIDFFIKAVIRKKKIIVAIDEFPVFERNPSVLYRFHKAYSKLLYKNYDDYIIMTRKLLQYYKKISKPKSSFLHLPMTVDCERFSGKIKKIFQGDYIAYCGNIGHNNKDGIPLLIEAFSISIR